MDWLDRFRRWRRHHADQRTLMQMNSRELCDIGIGRGEVDHLLALAPRYEPRTGIDASRSLNSRAGTRCSIDGLGA
jgi:uncharacterized protein YjiS (DUF1127 family)